MKNSIAIIAGLHGTYTAHTTTIFGNDKKVKVKYKLYDSHDPQDAIKIENSLKNKVFRKIYKAIVPLQVLKKFGNAIAEIGSKLIGISKHKDNHKKRLTH